MKTAEKNQEEIKKFRKINHINNLIKETNKLIPKAIHEIYNEQHKMLYEKATRQ